MKKTESNFFTEADKKIIAKMIEGASPQDIERFVRTCERTGLDPFTRQIYGRVQRKKVKAYGQPDKYEPELIIITSIDGLRAISEASGKYLGQTKPEWYYLDHENSLGWHDVFIPRRDQKGVILTLPEACRVGIHKEGFVEPCYGVANFESFAQYVKQDNEKWTLNTFWNRMPEHMIAKVAEAMGHRKASPMLASGIYLEEEVKGENDDEVIVPLRSSVQAASSLPPDMKMADPVPPGESQKAPAEPAPTTEKKSRKNAKQEPPAEPPANPAVATAKQEPAAPTVAPWQDYTLQFVKLPAYKGKKLSEFSLDDLEALKSGWCEMNAAKITGDAGREKERDSILAAFDARFEEMKASKS